MKPTFYVSRDGSTIYCRISDKRLLDAVNRKALSWAPCSCRPGCHSLWDTLAFSADFSGYAWTVHHPGMESSGLKTVECGTADLSRLDNGAGVGFDAQGRMCAK
jgi:hypothetical protein